MGTPWFAPLSPATDTVILNSMCIFIQLFEFRKIFFVNASHGCGQGHAPGCSPQVPSALVWVFAETPPGREPLSGPGLEDSADELGTGLQPSFGKPALVDFKYEPYRFDRAVRNGGLGLHVLQINYRAIVGDESRSQGYQGVFHPKTLLAGRAEFKQHAFLLRHFGPEHKANGVLLRCPCDLRLNLVDADRQNGAWQVRLG